MIWGMSLQPGQRYPVTILQDEIHLSMAALDSTDDQISPKKTKVMVHTDTADLLLCTLVPGLVFQQTLDIRLHLQENLSFSIVGQGAVHITGYVNCPPEFDHEGDTHSDHYPEEWKDEVSDQPYEEVDIEEEERERTSLEAQTELRERSSRQEPEIEIIAEEPESKGEGIKAEVTLKTCFLEQKQKKAQQMTFQQSNPETSFKAQPDLASHRDTMCIRNSHQNLPDIYHAGHTMKNQRWHDIHPPGMNESPISTMLPSHDVELPHIQPAMSAKISATNSDQDFQQNTAAIHMLTDFHAPYNDVIAETSAKESSDSSNTEQVSMGIMSRQHQKNNDTKSVPSSSFACPLCKKVYSSNRDSEHHICGYKLSCNKPFQCEFCGRCFKLKGDLKRHTFFHTGLKPFKCKVCGKDFAYSWNLKQHRRVHTGYKPFECDECGKTFSRRKQLLHHTASHNE